MGFYLRLFFTGAGISMFFWPLSAADSTNTVTAAVTETEMSRMIDRLKYLQDPEVVKRGIKNLDKLVKAALDLSWRADIRQALLGIILADSTKPIGADTKIKAGELIGRTKILNSVSPELIDLLNKGQPSVPEAAIREFVKATHSVPIFEIMKTLEEKKNWALIREIVIETEDDRTTNVLIEESVNKQRYNFLYGINHLRAADLVVKHILEQLEGPLAPSELKAIVTTLHSVQLSWRDNSLGEESFFVERAEGEQDFTTSIQLPSNQIYYSDTTVEASKNYRYRIRARNLSKADSLSEVITVSMPAPPPPAPLETPPAENPPAETPPTTPAETTNPAESPPDSPPTNTTTNTVSSLSFSSEKITRSFQSKGISLLNDETPPPTSSLPEQPPPLPESPAPSISFESLIPSIKIEIQDGGHFNSIDALIRIIKKLPTSYALKAASVLATDFSRDIFEDSPEATSLGLRAISELRARAELELHNFEFSEANTRRGHSDRLKKNASDLEKRFSDE